jgi:DNA-binding transcriptional LysR family regulator
MHHLRFLNYIDAIARTGSIRAAAQRLHIAPSAVNRRLQDIEDELGAQLFERRPRGMKLNEAGSHFIAYIRRTQRELDQVLGQLASLKGLRQGRVKVVVSQGMSSSAMPLAIQRFKPSHPLVDFEVTVGDHVQALQMLRSMEVDLALVFNLEKAPDVRVLHQGVQGLCALMHPEHPLSGVAQLKVVDCLAYPLALPNRDKAARQMIEAFCLERGLALQASIESNSFEFLRHALTDAQTITFQFEGGVPPGDDSIRRVALDEEGLAPGLLSLACLAKRELPSIATRFAEHLALLLT